MEMEYGTCRVVVHDESVYESSIEIWGTIELGTAPAHYKAVYEIVVCKEVEEPKWSHINTLIEACAPIGTGFALDCA